MIRIGEIGKSLYISTGFDLSSNTALQIDFKSPDGSEFTRTNPEVTAPAVDSPNIPGVGVIPANTYLLYLTQEDDFNLAGAWCLNSVYIEGTTKKFIGDSVDLQVVDAC